MRFRTSRCRAFGRVAPLATLLATVWLGTLDTTQAASWRAGSAKVRITPERPIWMSGYASRDRPADGTLHDLWAKVLVVQDPAGERIALITLDLVGIDRQFSKEVCVRLEKDFGLARRQVALSCSHTHTGPVIGDNLRPMYGLTPQQESDILEYTHGVQAKIVAAVGEAIQQLTP